MELERERLKREGSESKRLVAALDEVALLQRQLATVRGDAERAAASEERLRADKESLDAPGEEVYRHMTRNFIECVRAHTWYRP